MQKQEVKKSESFTKKVVGLAENLVKNTRASIDKIEDVNEETQTLSINASIEASRVGKEGKSFSVVADHMGKLAEKTSGITEDLTKEIHNFEGAITELKETIKVQHRDVRGTRLSDLALVNIELIDRNLFERTADVRWWAAGGKLTLAALKSTEENIKNASDTLKTILGAYTVYYDLVLADNSGKIISNGKFDQFNSEGMNVADTEWFKTALKSANVGGFGFQTVHHSPLVNDQLVLVYSAVVRDNRNDDKIVGVLGAVFNWEALAQKIVNSTPIAEEEKAQSRICIVDNDGQILADTQEKILEGSIKFSGRQKLFSQKKGFTHLENDSGNYCIAQALSPGYEGYSTGWHSVIMQRIEEE